MTANQMVARQLRRARMSLGLTQAQAAELLEPYLGRRWSKASFSAAEKGRRVFDANEILALSQVFSRPVGWFLEGESTAAVHAADSERLNRQILTRLDLIVDLLERPERKRVTTEQMGALLRGGLAGAIARGARQ